MNALEVRSMQVSRGGRQILRDISFTLPQNEWMMLVGPNGAGKSTLLGALSGSAASAGEILVLGQPLRRMKPKQRAKHIGMLSQLNPPSADLTVREAVALGRYAERLPLRPLRDAPEAVREALRAVGLQGFENRRLTALSGGELQRVMLAQVFCQDPDILLLDEPANHLDLQQLRDLFDLLNRWRMRPGKALVTVVHDLSLARHYGSCALVLHGGRAAAQGSIEACFRSEILRPVWGMDVPAYFRQLADSWREDAP